ncbi:kappa-scoloptoxin(11)-Ssd1b-like [Bombus impatiens]|uniref:Kappa-scoloptoxin(11)-Ssd1b-like n=1 Tax=Bombus impatiens TaxID=132113 RepID=A0A6P3UST5_BOMIM|nr:kappa-scoloptoxin(11)-Ssd1b-like [Bombus impatiens]
MIILINFLLFTITKCFSSYVIISSKLNNTTFKYWDGINGESDLHECVINAVCSVTHNRFWVSSLTERLCRCSNGKECPWQWTKELGNSSISLNNKSHMKFCAPITELSTCKYNQEGIEIHGKSDRNNSYLIPYNVILNCNCPGLHYWRLKKYTYLENDFIIQTFKCVKRRMCNTYEFCGHIRSDLYSTYYRCTCPENHLCIFQDRNKENVQELLYSGSAYKGYCLPFNNA